MGLDQGQEDERPESCLPKLNKVGFGLRTIDKGSGIDEDREDVQKDGVMDDDDDDDDPVESGCDDTLLLKKQYSNVLMTFSNSFWPTSDKTQLFPTAF